MICENFATIIRSDILYSVGSYLGDKILEHYIQEEIWVKRIFHKIFPPRTFKRELIKVINETIIEYESTHPHNENDEKFPFYHSQILLDALSQHILFDKNQSYSIVDIQNKCGKNSNIIRPTQNELDDFYSLFVSKVNSNEELSRLYIDENYKKRIYEISGVTNTILDILLKAELTTEIVFNNLREQTQYQVDKQKRSGKYIPKTFIETNELKDHLRYFAAPFVFIDKIHEELENMKFDWMNHRLKLKHNQIFDFSISKFPLAKVRLLSDDYHAFYSYVNAKYNELEQMQYNDTISKRLKLQDKVKDLTYVQSRVIILKSDAGQGKTNLLCDFAENVLIKRNIPSAFFTGYELNADNICNSIVQKLFPGRSYTFNDVFSRIENYCEDNNTFFILLIDGLNENSNPQQFSQELESFINEVLKYKHVKIILSCRIKYYHHNFENLSKANFSNLLIQVDNLNHQLSEDGKKRLYKTYLSYFQITINDVSEDIYEQLVDNFLLLRIFSEAYQVQNISQLSHIYKDELFQKYYDMECKIINHRLSGNGFTNNLDISNFFKLMIQYMIEHNSYENIPLDEILSKDSRNQDIYIRFLDENILVRKDLDNQFGVFGSRELVNFTFDEFRDFLITDYLLREVYPHNNKNFENFLNHIDLKSRIKEGCMSFLFSMERKLNDKTLSDIIHNQAWYKEVFPYYIFDIEDSYVTKDDKMLLKEIFLTDANITKKITLSLAYQRLNEKLFPNLNIQLLFEILNNLTDEEFNSNIYPIYPIYPTNYSFYHSKNDLCELIEELQEMLNETDSNSQPYIHNIFLYILYFMPTPLSYEIQCFYKEYWNKHGNKAHLKLILKSNSTNLKNSVSQFMRNYEIQL